MEIIILLRKQWFIPLWNMSVFSHMRRHPWQVEPTKQLIDFPWRLFSLAWLPVKQRPWRVQQLYSRHKGLCHRYLKAATWIHFSTLFCATPNLFSLASHSKRCSFEAVWTQNNFPSLNSGSSASHSAWKVPLQEHIRNVDPSYKPRR